MSNREKPKKGSRGKRDAGDAQRAEQRLDELLEGGLGGMPEFLDSLEAELAAGPETGAHRRVGPYRIIRSIGRGGMGAVYLAERADHAFDKRVALKLLPWGLDSAALRERFLAERQILASLEHPHIARLLDGGTTEDNLPYIVMEWVDGEPADRHCERNELGVRQILSLFLDICAALQYAHQCLIVHRDIKPGNVLVDAGGNVKLLDFGIAKLLPRQRDAIEATRPGIHPLTPEYAAPEQLSGGPITTATDVYALGVMLYRLLAERAPYELGEASLDQIVGAVCETEPPPPSAAARADRARRLRGDLDAIARKAMAKEPRQRYESVAELAGDIRNHLQGQPIQARPPTAGYRLGKFLGRHRVGVSATAAVILALAAGFGSAVWQARERAEAARQAMLEAQRAESVSAFLVSLFEAADPAHSQGEELAVKGVFDQGVLRIRDDLAHAPGVKAEMLHTMAQIAQRLGDHVQGLELVDDSIRLRQSLFGERSPETARALRLKGSLLGIAGRRHEARALLEQALAIDRQQPGPASGAVADNLVELASLHLNREQSSEALPLLEEALAIRRNAPDSDANRAEVARIQGQRAIAVRQQGRLQRAASLYREALDGLEAELGDYHPETVRTRNSLAALNFHRGRYAEAETLFRSIEANNLRVFGVQHPLTVTVRNNLAAVLLKQGKAKEAAGRFREILDYWREEVGPDHPRSAITQVNLAAAHRHMGELEQAELLCRNALSRFEAAFGPDNPYVAITLTHLAETMLARNDADAARRHAQRALAIMRQTHPGDHPQVARVHHVLGSVLRTEEEAETARRHFETALAMRKSTLGDDHPDTRASRDALASLAP